ncbi:sarcosine oxidase [Branchiibius hedensis]|uniref:Sarcosine oxidase n=1 Tax=Branchiibius hedensis TaxID=672460 RepID=A0A2Y8ZUW0_9MICO|nr:FAD-dependent oxidoreductase [Branchiibius hedensis]PWJ27390.1 sarcosine oxidase [Branchiibius hedensis]SSA36200.1 sarcosine oxidase [Branchiibius hedensis]
MTRGRIGVVGAGVAGSSAAWHLTRAGYDVEVFEQYDAGHDQGSSHGSSRIFRLAYPHPTYVALAVRALLEWRRLEEEVGSPLLDLTGAIDHGPADALEPVHAALRAAGQRVEYWSGQDVADRWPGLRVDTTALHHPDAGRLHADRAVAALQTAATGRGARLRFRTPVRRLLVRADGRVDLKTDDSAYVVDQVVVAPGAWAAGSLLDGLVHLPPLRVTQEQPVHFAAQDPLSWPSFIHHGGAGLPAGGGTYGLGSVDGVKVGFHAVGHRVEVPEERDRSIDEIALQKVKAYARQWLPGVDADRASAQTCLYTLTPDHDFIADRRGPVTVLAGFSGHGFKFGSVLGALAVDLIEGREPLPVFSLDRQSLKTVVTKGS